MSDVKFDVFVIGSCMTDLICYSPRLPKSGETLNGTKFTVGFGGKGANQCIAAAKLGASCALLAKLGNDNFGINYFNHLKELDINVEHVLISDGDDSGIAQICVTDSGENSIVIIPGANRRITLEDVNKAENVISRSKIILFQFEIPSEVILHSLKLCQQYNCKTVVNIAPAYDDIDPQILSLADILVVNENEAEAVTKLPVETIEDAYLAVTKLRNMGSKIPVITLGSLGAVVLPPVQNSNPVHVPTIKIENVIDTTGAGDYFIGTLAFILAKHPEISVVEAIGYACKAASMTVRKPGTQSSFLDKNDPDISEMFRPLTSTATQYPNAYL